jgi:hypothetical protein
MSADERLLAAVKSGDVAAARAALDSGADKERKDAKVRCGRRRSALCAAPHARSRVTRRAQYGRTPLSWAAWSGHSGVVQLLVEQGADVGTTNNVRCDAPAAALRARLLRVRLPLAALWALRRRGGAGALAAPCARFAAPELSVCPPPAPRARTNAALRGSCAERHASPRRAAPRCAASVLACAAHAHSHATRAPPHPPHFRVDCTVPLCACASAAGCGCASVPPALLLRYARALPCCADAAAASLSAAALRRCGCAQNGNTPLHQAAVNGHVECVALLVERGANKEAKNNVRCAAPSPAAVAAACCIGSAASAHRCALQQWGACVRVRGATGGAFGLCPSAASLSRGSANRASTRMLAAACGHGCDAAAARGRGGASAAALAACCLNQSQHQLLSVSVCCPCARAAPRARAGTAL